MTFDDFWKAWPYKRGRLDAMKAWNVAVRTGVATPEEIIAGVEPYKVHKEDWRAWMLPAKFIRQGFFLDEYEDETPLHHKSYEDWTDENKRFVADFVEKFRGKIEDPLSNMGFGPRNDIEQRLRDEGYMDKLRVVG